MFHYFEAITNTRGDALIGYYVKAVDTTSGDVASIYADDNATPIISVSGIADAAQVDSDGNASFYVVGGEYHLDIYATDGTTLVKRIENVPMTSAATVVENIAVGNIALPPVASRTALAALTGLTVGNTVFLTEDGRVGAFIWDSSDLSTLVTADTAQGIYVAPASASTGASGAWIRQFDGPVLLGWFGIVADDDDGVSGTNNAAAISAMVAVINARAKAGQINPTIFRGGDEVLIVGRIYAGTTTIEPLATLKLRGIGGMGDGAPSRIRFAAGTTGLRVQSYQTSGAGTVDGAVHFSGDRSVVQDIYFLGAFTTTEAEAHGIHAKRAVHVERCTFENFEGDGFYINATAGGGAPTEGNANVSRVVDCDFIYCRNGISTQGSDSNACSFVNCSFISNRRWGIKDDSFLGNHNFGHHFDSNGVTVYNTGTAALPTSYVSHGGNWYFAIHGQETGASTNAPSGTTADNTWWGYWQAGAPTTARPAWVSGITVRSGGPILINGATNASTIYGSHCESNGIAQVDQYGYVDSGSTLGVNTAFVSTGVLLRNRGNILRPTNDGLLAAGNFKVAGDFTAYGATNNIGPNTGTTASDGVTTLATRNLSHVVYARIYDAAGSVTSTLGYLSFSGNGFFYNVGNGAQVHTFQVAGADVASVHADGFHVTGLGAFSGALTAASLAATGAITSSSATAGIGYVTGAGGAVTQLTSKSTAPPAINKVCGQITMNNAALAAGAKVSFTVSNTSCAALDAPYVWVVSGGTTNAYRASVTAVAASSFTVTVENITAGSLSEAPVIGFFINKAVAS